MLQPEPAANSGQVSRLAAPGMAALRAGVTRSRGWTLMRAHNDTEALRELETLGLFALDAQVGYDGRIR